MNGVEGPEWIAFEQGSGPSQDAVVQVDSDVGGPFLDKPTDDFMVVGFVQRCFPHAPAKRRKGLGVGNRGGGMRGRVRSQREGFVCSSFPDELFYQGAGVPVIHGYRSSRSSITARPTEGPR